MKTYKRANGTGSVYKLSGRRLKPYIAIVTTGYHKSQTGDGMIQKRTPIGYFETRDEALMALLKYNRNPYDIRRRKLKFSEVYQEWSEKHFNTISHSAIRTYKSAYQHFEMIHDRKFTDIRPHDLELCIYNAPVHSATKKRMKSLCGLLYQYAIKNEIIAVNYAEYLDKIKTDPPVYDRTPFTDIEIKALWKKRALPYIDIIIIALFTGFRPSELLTLKLTNIKLDEGYMVGGSKTEAGMNRIIPIHSRIEKLIQARFKKSESLGSIFLISDDDGTPISYFKYRRKFNDIMKMLHMNHLPHDTRHTFISMAKECNVDEYILKLIVGHSIGDITERVYTHRNIENLKKEIQKIGVKL